jgi:hypothetical protein
MDRRIELAEKKAQGLTSAAEDEEFARLQEQFFSQLRYVTPGGAVDSAWMEQIERRLNGQEKLVAEVVCRLIEADPHSWSSRPCQTCVSISELIGRPFGCRKKAEAKGGVR